MTALPPSIRDVLERQLFYIVMLGFTGHRPIRWRIERASKIPENIVGVQFEETRHRDLSQR
jgi:hypothetical protein